MKLVVAKHVRGQLTVRVGEADSQGDSLGLTLADIGGSVPHPRPVGADVGRKLHLGNNVVVGADLEGLVAAHHKTRLAVLLVLEQSDVSSSALLPLARLLDELK